MRSTLSVLSLFVVVACDTTEAPEQLEASYATNDQLEDHYDESSASGLASVSGADRDWSIVFVGEDEVTTTLGLHLPGGSDLSAYDGQSLSVDLGWAWGDDSRWIGISDEDGLALIVQPNHLQGPAADTFGLDFVGYGDEISTGKLSDEYGTYKVSYRYARFQTDDGPVDVLPGEPFEARIDGQDWRVVVHASFEVTDKPKDMPGCGGGISDTLGYEMQRLDEAAEPSLDLRLRDAGAEMAGKYSCG